MAQMRTKGFGQKLRQFRKQNNMTLAEVADILGCSAMYVSYMETGKKPISQVHMLKWLDFLNQRNEDTADWCTLYRTQPKNIKPQWWSVEEREVVVDLLDGMFDSDTLAIIRAFINNLKSEEQNA